MVTLYYLNEEIDQKSVTEEGYLGIRKFDGQLFPLSTFYKRDTFSTIFEIDC